MNRRLHVIGTGGFAKETAQLADAVCRVSKQWDEIVYLCASPALVGTPMPFGPVIGTEELLLSGGEPLDVAIGIGMPSVRQRVAGELGRLAHLRFPNLIHPRATFDQKHVSLGLGNLVTAGCVFTCDITVGDFNVFNLSTTVGHDAVIGSFNVFNPGCNLSGNVRIGDACLGGTGCQVLERITMPSRTVLGAGAVLVKSIAAEGGVYAGVPAKQLR